MALLVSPIPATRRAPHVIVHLSDTDLVPPGDLVLGEVDACEHLLAAVDLISAAGYLPDAIVITGDLTWDGSEDAYRVLRDLTGELRGVRGVPTIVTPGERDDKETLARVLQPGQDTTAPQSQVYDVGGLRVVTLDTTIAGAECGRISAEQLEWLEDVLVMQAPYGTVLAMHHPPVRSPASATDGTELINAEALAEVIGRHPVRAILAGHYHFAAQSTFAGAPVNIAPATSYGVSLLEANGDARGFNTGQGFSLVHLYDDRVMFTTVPLGRTPELYFYTRSMRQAFEAMPREQQQDLLRQPLIDRLPGSLPKVL